jgi:hypothetical protein
VAFAGLIFVVSISDRIVAVSAFAAGEPSARNMSAAPARMLLDSLRDITLAPKEIGITPPTIFLLLQQQTTSLSVTWITNGAHICGSGRPDKLSMDWLCVIQPWPLTQKFEVYCLTAALFLCISVLLT